MSQHTINETCSCGATFTGMSMDGPASCGSMAERWRSGHVCPLRESSLRPWPRTRDVGPFVSVDLAEALMMDDPA